MCRRCSNGWANEHYAIDFAPHVPTRACCWALLAICVGADDLSLSPCARAAPGRAALAFAVLLLALANPLIVHETREPLPDVAAHHRRSLAEHGHRGIAAPKPMRRCAQIKQTACAPTRTSKSARPSSIRARRRGQRHAVVRRTQQRACRCAAGARRGRHRHHRRRSA